MGRPQPDSAVVVEDGYERSLSPIATPDRVSVLAAHTTYHVVGVISTKSGVPVLKLVHDGRGDEGGKGRSRLRRHASLQICGGPLASCPLPPPLRLRACAAPANTMQSRIGYGLRWMVERAHMSACGRTRLCRMRSVSAR